LPSNGSSGTTATHIHTFNDMLLCMRTTIDLPDELMRTVKQKAVEDNTTLREIFDRALRQYLAGPQPQKPFKLRLKPHPRGKMLIPESVLESRDKLHDFLDGIG
jgi:hypothetical protein